MRINNSEGLTISMKDIRQQADYSTIHATVTSHLFKAEIDPARFEQLSTNAAKLFPDANQRAKVESYLKALMHFHGKYKQSGNIIDAHDGVNALRYKAKEEVGYETAARLVRTILPQEAWEKQVLPRLQETGLKNPNINPLI